MNEISINNRYGQIFISEEGKRAKTVHKNSRRNINLFNTLNDHLDTEILENNNKNYRTFNMN